MKCGIGGCADPAVEVVTHPRREEPRTPVCNYHAGNIHRAPNVDAEVVADV